jgi:TP53 regulating kinase-like protein
MRLLKRGAEAELFLSRFDGQKAVLKRRVRKGYRCRELDEALRTSRTSLEARLLAKARKLGVKTPVVYSVDRDRKEIAMEFVEGKTAKAALQKSNFGKICVEIGKNIAKMHSFGLVHGDLTTSNIIVSRGKLFFVDFGLGANSRKIEDKAVDLLVFRKTFEATHANLMPAGWEKITEGYLQGMGAEGKRVMEHTAAIEKRARYH